MKEINSGSSVAVYLIGTERKSLIFLPIPSIPKKIRL